MEKELEDGIHKHLQSCYRNDLAMHVVDINKWCEKRENYVRPIQWSQISMSMYAVSQ